MSFISNFMKNRSMSNLKEKEFEENDKIATRIETKKKSHYERELLNILEKERQDAIKEALKFENRRRIADEKWRARQMMTSDVHLLQ